MVLKFGSQLIAPCEQNSLRTNEGNHVCNKTVLEDKEKSE